MNNANKVNNDIGLLTAIAIVILSLLTIIALKFLSLNHHILSLTIHIEETNAKLIDYGIKYYHPKTGELMWSENFSHDSKNMTIEP